MKFRAFLALVPLCLAPVAAAADMGPFGPPTAAYSADSTITADGKTISARVHADSDRERREIGNGDAAQIMLIDHKAKKATMLIVEQKVAMEVDMSEEDGSGGPREMKWTTEALGEEPVGGVAATKHRVDGQASGGARVAGLVWVTPEMIPVKSELDVTEEGETVHIVQELSNLKVGPVDAGLFAVPEDYKRMQMPKGPPGAPAPRQ